MDSLDYSLETLALNQLSYGTLINNVWTWIAVVSAAVSFWMIRAAAFAATSVSKKPATRCLAPPDAPTSLSTDVVPSSPAAEMVVPEPASTFATTTWCAALSECTGVTTRGKFFSVYYSDTEEDDVREDGGCDDGEYEVISNGEVDGGKCRFRGGWDSVMMMRMGNVEWYDYQDLRVLDGNVVRLWDDCRRRSRNATSASGAVVVPSY